MEYLHIYLFNYICKCTYSLYVYIRYCFAILYNINVYSVDLMFTVTDFFWKHKAWCVS